MRLGVPTAVSVLRCVRAMALLLFGLVATGALPWGGQLGDDGALAAQPPPNPQQEALKKALTDIVREGINQGVEEARKKQQPASDWSWGTIITSVGGALTVVLGGLGAAGKYLMDYIRTERAEARTHEEKLAQQWREHEEKMLVEQRQHEKETVISQRAHEEKMMTRFEAVIIRIEKAGQDFSEKAEEMQAAAHKEDKARSVGQATMHRENSEHLIRLTHAFTELSSSFGALRDAVLTGSKPS